MGTIDVDGKTIALGGSKYPAFLTKFSSTYSNATIQVSQEKLSPAKGLETPIYRLKLKPSDPQYVLFRRNNRIRTYNTSLAKRRGSFYIGSRYRHPKFNPYRRNFSYRKNEIESENKTEKSSGKSKLTIVPPTTEKPNTNFVTVSKLKS